MKVFTLFLALLLAANATNAQNFTGTFDTLFIANFESDSPFEPTDLDLGQPTGNDFDWVNFDEDGHPQLCFQDTTTFGWFPAFDFTDPSQMSTNYAFTSCSFTENNFFPCAKKTRNWLIMPPIQVLGSIAKLEWKSATYYGPYWVDGYKVLVSTTDNFPTSFTDTVFVAAQMIRSIGPFNGSLDPDRYVYSPGYVHADRYTLPQYFISEVDPAGADFFLGQFEPHSVDLSKYSGQRIYVAFLHDSECDDKLQIDDILVVDNHTTAAKEPSAVARFDVQPNPVTDYATIVCALQRPTDVQFSIRDIAGKTVWQNPATGQPVGETKVRADLSHLPPGAYWCQLQTSGGEVLAQKIIKI